MEALPGVLGNRGVTSFISGEQGNKSLKLKGTGVQMLFRGTWNIENRDFDVGEQGKIPFFFQGNKGTGNPPREGPDMDKCARNSINQSCQSNQQCLQNSFVYGII